MAGMEISWNSMRRAPAYKQLASVYCHIIIALKAYREINNPGLLLFVKVSRYLREKMTNPDYYKSLENMYAAAPINQIYRPTLKVSEGMAEVAMQVSEKFHHAGGALHGSVYFKMLDDSAWFAANSYELEFFVLTNSFTTYRTRPASRGLLKAVGKVVSKNKSQYIAESVVYDSNDKEIGRGNGIFVRSKMPLVDAMGYSA